MPQIAVVVPTRQVLAVLDGLLLLYANKAELVVDRTHDHADGDIAADVLLREREQLIAIDEAVRQVGWGRAERDGPARLETDDTILVQAVHYALIDATEGLAEITQAYAIPGGDLSPIRDALDHTIEAYDLLDRVEHPRPLSLVPPLGPTPPAQSTAPTDDDPPASA